MRCNSCIEVQGEQRKFSTTNMGDSEENFSGDLMASVTYQVISFRSQWFVTFRCYSRLACQEQVAGCLKGTRARSPDMTE